MSALLTSRLFFTGLTLIVPALLLHGQEKVVEKTGATSDPNRDTSKLENALLGHWKNENNLAYLKFSKNAVTYIGNMDHPPDMMEGSYIRETDPYAIEHTSKDSNYIKLAIT
jgi:hypothetical protein